MRRVLAAACAVALSACSAQSPDDYTLTVVDLHDEDPPTVTITTITATERHAAGALGELAQAIHVANACGTNAMHLFDQVSFGGNEICFRGGGTVKLRHFTRTVSPPTTWAKAVRSFIAGQSGGEFIDANGQKVFFMSGEQRATVGTVVKDATKLMLFFLPKPVDMAPDLSSDMSLFGADLSSDLSLLGADLSSDLSLFGRDLAQ